MQRSISANRLFYGDNLDILRDHVPTESIDLIYLDPPFNSNRNYNVLFKDESGEDNETQIEAFEDTWHWSHVEAGYGRDLRPHELPHGDHLEEIQRPQRH